MVVAMATWASIKFVFYFLETRQQTALIMTTSLASLPIEMHNELFQYLTLQDLHSTRFLNHTFYFTVTLFVLRQVTEQLEQTDIITIIDKKQERKIFGSADINNSTATIPAANIEYDAATWRCVFFSLTINGQVLKWVCPEGGEGMTGRAIKDKCRTVGGFRSNPKRVRMSMYLDLANETPLPATPSSDARPMNPTTTTSIKSNRHRKQPPKTPRSLFRKWIYLYFNYNWIERRGKIRRKLISIEISIPTLLPQTLVR